MQCGDNDNAGTICASDLSNTIFSTRPSPLSQMDYPLVKFWEKKSWKNFSSTRKDASEVETKAGARGGTRSSRGENVMMLYVEDASGTPIDGNIASGMRDLARSIWRSLYERGIAPETWGQATKEVREEYFQDMESNYPVLRLCDNHWKANSLATTIYSQWYKTYDKRVNTCADDNINEGEYGDGNNGDNNNGDGCEGPPRKKTKSTIIFNNDAHFSLPEPETHADNEGSIVITPSTDANNSTEQSQSNSISDLIQPVGPVADNHYTSHAVGTAATENTVHITDTPNIDTITLAPNTPNIDSDNVDLTTSGVASTSTPTQTEVLQTGDPIPTPLCPINPAVMKALYKKRYQHTERMKPGISITAR